jgi:broad specificity phosphatase PhoE
MIKNIYLLRHGLTLDSENAINGSQRDTPLSEKGLIQASDLVTKLSNYDFDLVIVSPLKRTMQTIQPYIDSLEHKPEVISSALTIERNLGDLSGSVTGDGRVDASVAASGKAKTDWQPPNGESTRQVYLRAQQFLEYLKNRNELNILVCGHQNFLRCLEIVLTNRTFNDRSFYSDSPARLDFCEVRKYQI